jgi:hypothetical protein
MPLYAASRMLQAHTDHSPPDHQSLHCFTPPAAPPHTHTPGRRKVYWHNMREEPVIYINGQPYVVREADQPFCNLEYTGIDRSRVEEMEERLKADILKEAHQYSNQILVTQEDDDMQVRA